MKRTSRRRFLAGAAGLALLPVATPSRAQVALESIVPAITNLTRSAPVNPGRVLLELPLLAENGHSVPLKVAVQSPMTELDYVRGIHLLSEKNPRPVMADFHLGPRAGRAQIVTRVRLAGSQRVFAVAEMSDGSFWYGMAEVTVTESACLDGT